MNLRFIFAATVAAASFLLSGCATNQTPAPSFYVASPTTVLAPPPADKAQIIFLMPKNLYNPHQAVILYDLTDENKKLFAMIGSQSKVIYHVNPGRRILLSAFGVHNHMMEANVEAGKRYYVLARFIYAGGFQLRPIRTAGPSDYSVLNPDFAGWVSGTKFVEKTPEAEALHEKTKASVPALQAAESARWMQKTPAQRGELTLNKEDAVAN